MIALAAFNLMGEAMQVSPRPFLVAVMVAGSAAFATPFGYQINALVYQIGRYRYMDFVRVGLPLNLITWVTAIVAIRISSRSTSPPDGSPAARRGAPRSLFLRVDLDRSAGAAA